MFCAVSGRSGRFDVGPIGAKKRTTRVVKKARRPVKPASNSIHDQVVAFIAEAQSNRCFRSIPIGLIRAVSAWG
jgi:hypothetical protein